MSEDGGDDVRRRPVPISLPEFRNRLRDRLQDERFVPDSDSHEVELVFNLTRLSNRLGQDFETLHRRHGWSWAGFRIMNVIWAVGPLELRDVARLTGSSKASISSALNTLERDGLVSRMRDAVDKRQVRVSLTEKGETELRQGVRLQAGREHRWLAALTRYEQRDLAAVLARLADQQTPPPDDEAND